MKLRTILQDRSDGQQEYVARLEQLLDIHAALAAAVDEQGILAAVARYADQQGKGTWLELLYSEPEESPHPPTLRYVAGWYRGQAGSATVEEEGAMSAFDVPLVRAWAAKPDTHIAVDNGDARNGAAVLIPLVHNENLIGALVVGWASEHNISPFEHGIYEGIQQSLSAAATRRRAYLAEQFARQELELLYRASAAINAANTVEEVTRVIASLDLAVTSERFTKKNRRIADAIATLREAAMDRIRLRKESEAARQRAEQYAAEAQRAAALEERNRLARQLHDSVSQALYGIALGARTARRLLDRDPAQAKEPLDYLLSLAEAGLTEMRALIFDLRPDALETEGLMAALTKQAKSVQTRHGIEMITNFCDEPELPGRVKEEIYRIMREALHNAVKHARASQIVLEADCQDEILTVEMRDNGVGFDINDSFPGHLGLRTMWERAHRLGAEMIIISAPQQGTRIGIKLPLAAVKDPKPSELVMICGMTADEKQARGTVNRR